MVKHLLEQLKVLSFGMKNYIHRSTVYALPVCVCVPACLHSVCMHIHIKTFYKIVVFPQVYELVKAGEQLLTQNILFKVMINDYLSQNFVHC